MSSSSDASATSIPADGPRIPLAVRTPDARFANLPGFDFSPHFLYVEGPAEAGKDSLKLRMHYVDEGPREAPVVLMTHGEPTWSYLYRKMIPVFVAAGLRAIAVDHVGFGRSDKLTQAPHYSFEGHIDRLEEVVTSLDLSGITLVCQDWGGPIGLGVLARQPDRFARVVAGNTMLHTAESDLDGRIALANHASGEANQTVGGFLLDWMLHAHRALDFVASASVLGTTAREVAPGVADAYDAPFPSEWHKAGMRQFPVLIPVTRNDPGAAINRATWKALASYDRPFLTLFGDADPSTRGWEDIFQERVPGAKGQPHRTLERAGHFWQEDCGDGAAQFIVLLK
jgi:haloalkane dehalogenase